MAFRDVEPKLVELLRAFGPPRKTEETQLPFWHLKNDGVWTLHGAASLQSPLSGKPSRSAMKTHAVGGFTPEIDQALRADPKLVAVVAHRLLDDNFEASMHDSILASVGLDLTAPPAPHDTVRETTSKRRVRDPEFRGHVLRIYEGRCAFCGYGGRLAHVPVAVDAAHIRWHAFDGPDTEDNGVAACALHHRALDFGAISISHEQRVMVSESFTSIDAENDSVLRIADAMLRAPLSGHARPARRFVDWHHRQVFRAPARK